MDAMQDQKGFDADHQEKQSEPDEGGPSRSVAECSTFLSA
jgi:hypothetical protein